MIVDSINTAYDIVMYYQNPTNSYLSFKLMEIKNKLEKNSKILKEIDITEWIKENRIQPLTNILKNILPKITIEYTNEKTMFIACPKNAIISKIKSEKDICISINGIILTNNKSNSIFSKTWFPFCLISRYELEITSKENPNTIYITYRFLPKYLIDKFKKRRVIVTIQHKDFHFYNNDIFSL
jgi:hypothetical protein